ncbi:RNA polymerase [Nibricoccus aquaticus]|uniref:RNA polymerase n=1 Tax=Nibricoccus aquaticus TaxID=2576891 RepID=A0A290QAV7_9BACT|nr:RNA polymerase sigma factor [Nibricoccus aquaticus]ATC65573.1 RNA polymerase [Nibricoccus aquaticus]
MSNPESTPEIDTNNDAELVAACLDGDRDAFARIVERYQRLLCSLAYSATGSMSTGEDIAQETFVEAWRKLHSLREPEKLRPWLCGILRHKTGRLRRRDIKEPVFQAETIDAAAEVAGQEEPATNLAMRKEEQAILWSELERVPEIYREPLILYYREHGSVEHVAAALDLSEDAVKQRLARGRRILQERVLAFVESALTRSTPGRIFTLGVLAALPAILPAPAKAAAIGGVTAQGAALAKTTGLTAIISSLIGVANVVLSLRAAHDQSRTPRERRAVAKGILFSFGGSLVFLAAVFGLRAAAFRWWEQRAVLLIVCQALVMGFVVALPVFVIRMQGHFRRIRSQERERHPECFHDSRDHAGSTAGEYLSKARLFGVPLLHVRFSLPDENAPPLFAWIAAGDRAYGLVFAWGTWAVAPISAGVVSIGLFSVGAVSIGVIGLGTVGVGLLAVGCISIGVKASAWLSALGWETARSNGFALARTAAEAPVAFAQNVNDPVARQLLANPHAEQTQMIFFAVLALLTFVPLVYYAQAVRKRLGRTRRN